VRFHHLECKFVFGLWAFGLFGIGVFVACLLQAMARLFVLSSCMCVSHYR